MNAADTFLDRFADECRRLGIADCSVVLAVSGGTDSTALLRCCEKLRNELRLDIIVGHLNHQLRDEASDEDETWVETLCQSLRVRFFSGRSDVAAAAAAAKKGIEETARMLRYWYLEQLANSGECRFVLTAHTADDQAETVLHHIVRGTGLGGLKGIAGTSKLNETVTLARPLRSFTRQEIIDYLETIDQDYRSDESNLDIGMTRNRIRHKLLPLLEAEFNPGVKAALCRLGAHAEGVYNTLAELADRWFSPAVEATTPESCRIDCEACVEIPPPIVREGLVRVWDRQQWPRQNMGATEWQTLVNMILQSAPSAKTFPGSVHVERRGNRLILQRR